MSDIIAAAKLIAADSLGNTALHRCTTLEEAEALVRLGLDVNAKNHASVTPLHSACANSRLEVAAALIAAGADVNAREGGDWTPLHYACSNGNLEIAQTLIAAGADVNARNGRGKTPFDLCKTDELKALFAPKGLTAFLTALKELLAQYE